MGLPPTWTATEVFLKERVSDLRPGEQAEIAWVFKAWETGQVWGIWGGYMPPHAHSTAAKIGQGSPSPSPQQAAQLWPPTGPG